MAGRDHRIGGAVLDQHRRGNQRQLGRIVEAVAHHPARRNPRQLLRGKFGQAGIGRNQHQRGDPRFAGQLHRNARSHRIADQHHPAAGDALACQPGQRRAAIGIEPGLARFAGIAPIAAVFGQHDAIARIRQHGGCPRRAAQAVTVAMEEHRHRLARLRWAPAGPQLQPVGGRQTDLVVTLGKVAGRSGGRKDQPVLRRIKRGNRRDIGQRGAQDDADGDADTRAPQRRACHARASSTPAEL